MKRLQKLCVVAMGVILLAVNADAGRWLTRDPIEHMERDPQPTVDLWDCQQQINLYQFVGNNPISRIDPLGLWWWDRGLIQIGGPQLLHDIFIGNNKGPAPDPNSQGALSQNAGYGFHPLYDEDGNPLGNPASAVGGTVVGGIVDAASLFIGGGEVKAVKCEVRNLQKIFSKHGVDFGLTGNWNPSRAADVLKALVSHVNDSEVKQISGSYRGIPGINNVNPTTGLNVFTDASGNVIAAWKLGSEQLNSVLKTGRLF